MIWTSSYIQVWEYNLIRMMTGSFLLILLGTQFQQICCFMPGHLPLRTSYIEKAFGSKGPKWGCCPCGGGGVGVAGEVVFYNIDTAMMFWNSQRTKDYAITCSTSRVIYSATCLCDFIYVGLTSRVFQRRTQESMQSERRMIYSVLNQSQDILNWHITVTLQSYELEALIVS